MPILQAPENDPVTDPNVGVLIEPEAARYIRISVWTLRRMHRDPERYGQPPRKLHLSANRIGYRKVTLDAWLAEREVAS